MKSKRAGALVLALLACSGMLLLITAYAAAQAESYPSQPVINGSDAAPGEFPWAAAIFRKEYGLQRGLFCGATLISPRYLLTAAHCAANFVTTPYNLGAVVGRTNLAGGSDGVIVEIDGVIVHPQFGGDNFRYDFALLRLRAPASQLPLPLFNGSFEPSVGTVAGWGSITSVGYRPATTLKKAEIPIMPQATCLENLGSFFHPDSMLCGGVLSSGPLVHDGVDACQGDSGGPLIAKAPSGESVLIGLVSWGYGCANQSFGAYAKIESAIDWIFSSPAVAPYPLTPPLIESQLSGETVNQKAFHCSPGRWGGDPVEWASYRWLRQRSAGSSAVLAPISGATEAVYTPTPADIGASLYCEIKAANKGGSATSFSSVFGPLGPEDVGAGTAGARALRLKRERLSCNSSRCELVVSIRDRYAAATTTSLGAIAMIEQSRSCRASSLKPSVCHPRSQHWLQADRASENRWLFTLPRRGIRKITLFVVASDLNGYNSPRPYRIALRP